MSSLHYQIWAQAQNWPGMVTGPHARRLIASGTIAVTNAMSDAIPVPAVEDQTDAVAVLKVIGSEPVYVQLAGEGRSDPDGTGAHAESDASPRVLLTESDGAQPITLPRKGKFAAVQAAAFA